MVWLPWLCRGYLLAGRRVTVRGGPLRALQIFSVAVLVSVVGASLSDYLVAFEL